MAVRRRWLWGDKRMGYALRILARKKSPYRAEVWYKGRCWRTDDFSTEAGAMKYAWQRKRSFYRRMSPAQARKKYL